jgi:hypothetical protein
MNERKPLGGGMMMASVIRSLVMMFAFYMIYQYMFGPRGGGGKDSENNNKNASA